MSRSRALHIVCLVLLLCVVVDAYLDPFGWRHIAWVDNLHFILFVVLGIIGFLASRAAGRRHPDPSDVFE